MGERDGHSMVSNLNRRTVVWIDWNLVLDETGGPNHVDNLCSAPILIDTTNDALMYQSLFYYIGNCARFVKPGAKRVLCAASRQDLEASAFVNPDSSVVTVVMNHTNAPIQFELRLDGACAATELPPHAIATYLQTN